MGEVLTPEQVGQQIRADLAEVKKLALPKGEAEERFKKIEGELAAATKALEDQRIRNTLTLPAGSANGAASYFHSLGMKSLRDIEGVPVFGTNAVGQTVAKRIVPEEVEQFLVMRDHLYLADFLLTRCKSKSGRQWSRIKGELGAREAFLKHVPQLAVPYDQQYQQFLALQGKTLTSTGAGTGDEWVPTLWSTNMLDYIRLQMPVVNLIPHLFQPSNPWRFPMLTGIPTAYRKIEDANAVASDLATGNKDWTAHVHATLCQFTDEVEEDSIVAIVPVLRMAIIRAMGEGIEEALINGDVDALTHFDFDLRSAGPNYRTYQGGINGLRHYALDPAGGGTASTVDGGGNSLSYLDIAAALRAMGKYRASAGLSDVVVLVSPRDYMELLIETSSPVVTLDTFGPSATILSGQLANIWGHAILISHGIEKRRDMVHSTGVNTTGQANTFSTALVFNRMNWRIGDRRDFRVEEDKDIVAGRRYVVSTQRLSMNTIEGDETASPWNPQGTPAAVAIVNIT